MVIPNAATSSTGASAKGSAGLSAAWVLGIAIVAYVAYALFQHHHAKLRSVIKPSNIAANIHNLAIFTLMLIIVGPLLRVFAAKWKAWGLPGGDTMVQIAGNT